MGVFYHPEALEMLNWFAAPIVVPAVVFAERSRQLAKAGIKVDELGLLLDAIGASVEPFTHAEATRYATALHDDAAWRRLARDAFIARHVQPGDRLFTTNPADFAELGVPEDQIVEVPVWRARARTKPAAKK